jgi:hypothetical protein
MTQVARWASIVITATIFGQSQVARAAFSSAAQVSRSETSIVGRA